MLLNQKLRYTHFSLPTPPWLQYILCYISNCFEPSLGHSQRHDSNNTLSVKQSKTVSCPCWVCIYTLKWADSLVIHPDLVIVCLVTAVTTGARASSPFMALCFLSSLLSNSSAAFPWWLCRSLSGSSQIHLYNYFWNHPGLTDSGHNNPSSSASVLLYKLTLFIPSHESSLSINFGHAFLTWTFLHLSWYLQWPLLLTAMHNNVLQNILWDYVAFRGLFLH